MAKASTQRKPVGVDAGRDMPVASAIIGANEARDQIIQLGSQYRDALAGITSATETKGKTKRESILKFALLTEAGHITVANWLQWYLDWRYDAKDNVSAVQRSHASEATRFKTTVAAATSLRGTDKPWSKVIADIIAKNKATREAKVKGARVPRQDDLAVYQAAVEQTKLPAGTPLSDAKLSDTILAPLKPEVDKLDVVLADILSSINALTTTDGAKKAGITLPQKAWQLKFASLASVVNEFRIAMSPDDEDEDEDEQEAA